MQPTKKSHNHQQHGVVLFCFILSLLFFATIIDTTTAQSDPLIKTKQAIDGRFEKVNLTTAIRPPKLPVDLVINTTEPEITIPIIINPLIPCIGQNKINFQSWTESILGLSGQCRSCQEIHAAIGNELSIFNEHHTRTCTRNSDCTTVWEGTPFRGACQAPVLASKKYIFDMWSQYYAESYPFDGLTTQLFHNMCGYATPMCIPVQPKCTAGKCGTQMNVLWQNAVQDATHLADTAKSGPL